jgi:hypothetical protein
VDKALFDLTVMPCRAPCLEPAAGSPFGNPEVVDLAGGDLNQDLNVDIVAAQNAPSGGQFLIGDGAGDFTSLPDILVPSTGEVRVQIANLNPSSDLFADLVLGVNNRVFVYLGDGAANFTLTTSSPSTLGFTTLSEIGIADLRADAIPDILATTTDGSNNGYVFALDGDGLGNYPVLRALAQVGRRPNGIAVGDFNLDGFPDIAASSAWDSNATVVLTDAAGNAPDTITIEVPGTLYYPRGVAIGNLNPDIDQFPDLAIIDAEGSSVLVVFGDGAGDFLDDPPLFPLDPSGSYWLSPRAVAIGDVTRDGRPDIVVATEFGTPPGQTLWILVGDGEGDFTPSGNSPIALGYLPNAVLLEDVDGDGVVDIVIAAGTADGGVAVLLNRPSF